MFKKLISKVVGDPNQKIIDSLQPIVEAVAALEPKLEALSDEALRGETAVLKQRLKNGETLEEIMADAYALVREASRRATGMRPYDVQIMGGVLLHRGEIVEMRTGEGKTLVVTLPLYLNALSEEGSQLVTVNEYLARRDGGWMGNIYHLLGLSTGCIGPQQFSALFDPDYVNPGAELEDERLVHWRPCTRQQAYQADVTYGISSEFGFDYLRDNMVQQPEKLVQRQHHFAVIDEVDNVLIDEARTPLIIAGPAPQSGKEYARFAKYMHGLKRNTADEDEEANGHYDLDEKSRSINLTDMGTAEIEKRIPEIDADAGDSLYDPRFYHLTYYLDNALKAEYMFKRDVRYVVQNGEVVIVDDFTGRLMAGRRFSEGLHEAIEAKEGVTIKKETITVATITLQNYFRLYDKLAGMTGTALTDAEEFDKIYELSVTPLPTNVQYIVDKGEQGLKERKTKVENANEIAYLDPDTNKPVFFKRTDYPDQVYGTEGAKDMAIVQEIGRVHQQGRPILVGTTSVEHSETIRNMLRQNKIEHSILNAKIHQSEALIVAQAGRRGSVTISTNMAGRGTDILLGGNPEGMTAEKMEKDLFDRNTLTKLALQLLESGPESARKLAQKHGKLSEDLVGWLQEIKEEFDAALVDIEEVQVIGYLARSLQEPYQIDYNQALTVLRYVMGGQMASAREYLDDLGKDSALVEDAARLWKVYGRYQQVHADPRQNAQFLAEILFEKHYNARAALIRAVLGGDEAEARQLCRTIPGLSASLIDRIHTIQSQATAEREEVWALGGLHVIGSERHESRRIDNQLRGRAARQGDPGSSRFFLSLGDDLMLRFGGERLKGFMSRTNIPEDMPIESGMLDRIIESSQERIEGYNFDMRKNIVEYDDVMTKQRQKIYGDRRAILLGEGFDLDGKVEESFAGALADLVDNYIDNYPDFIRGEIDRAILDFSTDATDTINITGVIARLRGFLPGIREIDRDELSDLSPGKLTERFMLLAYENEAEGRNLYQLIQAMGRFLPLLPPVPNLAVLASRRGAQIQARENIRRDFLSQVEMIYNEFLAQQIEPAERQRIWQQAADGLNHAFSLFTVEGLSAKNAPSRQLRFKHAADETLRDLLIAGLSALDGESLVAALNGYVSTQQAKWRQHIGEDEYQNFQRLLLLSAIDNEWRDYLTAMDDLRREIGISTAAQKDPKVEYKRRSYEMFADMRHNIDMDVVDRFFRQVASHQAFVQRQQQSVAYQEQAQSAGYQAVKRSKGKGTELRRDTPKVGRNDPCPCGSGKKYKQCHGRRGQTPLGNQPANTQSKQPQAGAKRPSSRPKKSKKKRKRRR